MTMTLQRRALALRWYHKRRASGQCTNCPAPATRALCEACHFQRYGPSKFALCRQCRKRRYNWTVTDRQVCRFCRRDRRKVQ